MAQMTEYQVQYLGLIREVLKRLTRIADAVEQIYLQVKEDDDG